MVAKARKALLAWLWNSSMTDSLPRNMFPANLVEATFKQVSGSLGSGGVGRQGQPGPREEVTGLSNKSPCLLRVGCWSGQEGQDLDLRASHGHTPALGSSFSGRKMMSMEGSLYGLLFLLWVPTRAHMLTASLSPHSNPALREGHPLSWMRKLRCRRIKGFAQGYATSR